MPYKYASYLCDSKMPVTLNLANVVYAWFSAVVPPSVSKNQTAKGKHRKFPQPRDKYVLHLNRHVATQTIRSIIDRRTKTARDITTCSAVEKREKKKNARPTDQGNNKGNRKGRQEKTREDRTRCGIQER